ncbi:MAG: hypothetical protein Q7R72_01680 [bacterium]|nr:hypothetical protein [bacterium]
MNSPVKKFLARAFPVPESLLLANVSVSISDGRLSFFELKRKSGKMQPKNFGMMPFPDIRLQNMNQNQKTEAVSVLFAFTKTQKYYYVHGIIHEGDAYIFRTTVPTIETNEIRQAVESILEENVPIPPIEAIFEYDVVSIDIVRGETTVAVSVVSEKIISAYTDLLVSGGLSPISFETESRSLSRALFYPDTIGIFLVLTIMENHSVIFIVENGIAVFSSSIDIRSKDINKTFSTIRDEIEKVLVFWKTQEKKIKNNISISRIMLVGSDSLIPGFVRYISICFKIPVSVGSVWTNVLSPEENVPKLSQRDSLNYGPCIGSLI